MSHATPLPDVAERTLPAAFARVLGTAPNDPLLLADDDGTYSYAHAYDRSLRLAGGLRRLGAAAGERVVLMLDNSADAALAWFATGLTRVVEVPVNTAYKGAFLSHVVHDSGAEIAIVEQAYVPRLAAVADALPQLRTVVVRGGNGRELPDRLRIKDALRRRGENISSFEVESVVKGHPAVAESAVVAVPSELTEDELKVAVVLRPGAVLDPAELIDYLVPLLPYFTVPRYVEVLDELPKTPTQKVQKAVLRAQGFSAGTWDREAHGITVGRS